MRIFFDTEFIEDGKTIDLLGDGPEHNALADARWLARVASPHLPRPLPAEVGEAEGDV